MRIENYLCAVGVEDGHLDAGFINNFLAFSEDSVYRVLLMVITTHFASLTNTRDGESPTGMTVPSPELANLRQ